MSRDQPIRCESCGHPLVPVIDASLEHARLERLKGAIDLGDGARLELFTPDWWDTWLRRWGRKP